MSELAMKSSLCLCVVVVFSACASAPPPPPPAKDEFQGFGALRGEPREKKKAEAADDAKGAKEEGKDDKGAKDDGKGEEKTALNKEQVLGAIGSAQKRVDACFKKHKEAGIYVMQITIAPSGSCDVEPLRAPTRKEQPDLWTDIEAGVDGGRSPKSPINRCLASALTQVKFPAFEGKPLVVTYPLVLR